MGGLIIAMNISIAVAFFSGLFWFMRWKYGHDLAPTKEFPHGKIVAEFWTPAGPRIRQLAGVLPNGFEIKPPADQKSPRYYFNKASVGNTKYPLNPIFPFSFLQVDAPIVSWYQDNPEPLPATKEAAKIGEKIVTSELLDLSRDTETLATAQAVNDELTKTQTELRKALTERISKTAFYVLSISSAVASLAAAVMGFMVYRTITEWANPTASAVIGRLFGWC